MKVKCIVCIAVNGGIGLDNRLLGHIPEDLKFFKDTTLGYPLFMGSKTARSLPGGCPLPKRDNYVLCREGEVAEFSSKGFKPVVARTVPEAIQSILNQINSDLFIIGGAFIYKESLQMVDEVFLNIGHDLPLNADTFFEGIEPDSIETDSRFRVLSKSHDTLANLTKYHLESRH